MGDENTKPESEAIQEIISKSEDEFEKKISYIGAGALLLSLTFLEKIINLESSHYVWILVLGWLSLTSTLLINLISHMISKIHLRKSQAEIEKKIDYEQRKQNHKIRVKKIEAINWFSVGTLIFGIICIILFSSLNAINANSKKNSTGIKQDTIKVQIINLKN